MLQTDRLIASPSAETGGLHVVRFPQLETLVPLASEWDRLSRGVPFRGWDWASTWWRHYAGADRAGRPAATHLFVLGVFDASSRLAGIAPWYLEFSLSRGRVVRFLGSGEVCSDHLSLLCEPGHEEAVAAAVAAWLTDATHADRLPGVRCDRWDLLDLEAVDAEDHAVASLAAQLEARGNLVHRRPGPNCWKIDLPETWEQYLARLSGGFRKQLRSIEKDLQGAGQIRIRTINRPEDLPQVFETLVDLHQRRHRQVGHAGSFASPRFEAFHRELMARLLPQGRLQLCCAETDGQPLVVEYGLVDGGVTYSYQSGIEPTRLDVRPGHIGHAMAVRRAIERGCRVFDFLRGDEPYKAHWRAQPQAMVEYRVVPAQAFARLRHELWRAASQVKGWLRRLKHRLASAGSHASFHAASPTGKSEERTAG